MHTGPAELFGVEFELFHGTIKKRDLQRMIEAKVSVTDRQARAAVSSYVAERWTNHVPRARLGINEAVCVVSSAAHRVLIHADRADEARAENGTRGGRPSKHM